MGITIARSLKIPVAAGIMVLLLFIGSLSPVLITELKESKSSYYNIKSSSSNLVDVPVWLVNDEWIYETEIDVSPALVGTDLDDPGVNIQALEGDTSLVVTDIRLEDIDGIKTLI